MNERIDFLLSTGVPTSEQSVNAVSAFADVASEVGPSAKEKSILSFMRVMPL